MSFDPKAGPDVLISEVGPRDGLQSVKATMPTEHKKRWISALHDAGIREIEVASFVPRNCCRRWRTRKKSSGMH